MPFEFDFEHVTAPFRMRPGLRRLAPESAQHLSLATAQGELHLSKAAVWAAKQAWQCAPGFDPLPGLQALAACSPEPRVRAQGADSTTTARELAQRISCLHEQDFCIIDNQPGSPTMGCVPFMCVCLPSRWAPEEKVGLSFAQIHTPVPESSLIVQASSHLMRLASGGEHWERFVWTISPTPQLDQHPTRWPASAWPSDLGASDFAQKCWLRTERQTLLPVLQSGECHQAVFTIQVMTQPLTTAVAKDAANADRLAQALGSMSQAVLEYKGLQGAQARLLTWLAQV